MLVLLPNSLAFRDSAAAWQQGRTRCMLVVVIDSLSTRSQTVRSYGRVGVPAPSSRIRAHGAAPVSRLNILQSNPHRKDSRSASVQLRRVEQVRANLFHLRGPPRPAAPATFLTYKWISDARRANLVKRA